MLLNKESFLKVQHDLSANRCVLSRLCMTTIGATPYAVSTAENCTIASAVANQVVVQVERLIQLDGISCGACTGLNNGVTTRIKLF